MLTLFFGTGEATPVSATNGNDSDSVLGLRQNHTWNRYAVSALHTVDTWWHSSTPRDADTVSRWHPVVCHV